MNRPRNRGNRDLPPSLYADRKGRAVYYRYKHPKTGRSHGMGADRTQAILAAQQLNSMLMVEVSMVDRVLGKTALFSAWLEKYERIRLEEKNLAEKSIRGLKYDISLMKETLGDIPVIDVTVYHCAEFLDQWLRDGKRRMAARMRSQLIKCFDYAVANGLADHNPAAKTLPVDAKVQRSRLTKAQFDAIYELAPAHIQNAMMIALITLQRREDIAAMQFKDIREGVLYVAQQKTSRAKKASRADSVNEAAHLAIQITPALADIISRCRKTGIVSRHLIHHLHGRKAAGATHTEVKPGMPLQPDNITRGFASARNRSGLFDDLPPKQRPTFHEIRSLGAHLYRDQGIDPQALLGHTDAKMTKHYLDGHGIEWTVVSADLAI